MAKPRIFISSTFYDLSQTRIDLDQFIESLGYESVRNEEGDIPYGKDEELQNYCYKEINNIDILVSIIGSRYGSPAVKEDKDKGKNYSVTQKEIQKAIELNKQVFIFIDKRVYTEYETYLLNKGNENVRYKYVDNVNIYKFIEEIQGLTHNNNIKAFESAQEITHYLREQFAGLFKQFIREREKNAEAIVIRDIRDTAQTLHDLVEYLKEDNTDKQDEINRIIKVNHPLVTKLKALLGIKYNFYIEGLQDLSDLLKARGYKSNSNTSLSWITTNRDEKCTITIANELFEKGRLKYINPKDWNEAFLTFTKEENKPVSIDDDLPF